MIPAYHVGYVLDASVAVKWFAATAEVDRDRALALRQRHATGATRLVVPGSFPLEVVNALRFSHRFGERELIAAVESLEALALTVCPIEYDLLRSAVAIASAYQVTLYDAVYVGLAERRGLPLLTADEVLVNRMKGHSIVLRLRDMEFAG